MPFEATTPPLLGRGRFGGLVELDGDQKIRSSIFGRGVDLSFWSGNLSIWWYEFELLVELGGD